jgi:hypothetical protein
MEGLEKICKFYNPKLCHYFHFDDLGKTINELNKAIYVIFILAQEDADKKELKKRGLL